MRNLVLAFTLMALTLTAPVLGCTETPSDLPECVGPNSSCPSLDGGDDATDAAGDAGLTHDASDGASGD